MMNYTQVSNVRYATADGSLINMDVTFEGLGRVPFTASMAEGEPEYAHELYRRALAGEFGKVEPYAEPIKTQETMAALVDAERDRRIDAGFTFKGKLYQTRQTDRENIAGASQIAFMAIVGGAEAGDLRWADPDNDYVWIAMDNTLTPMDAQTVVEFGKAAAARKTQLIYAARELKNQTPVPVDYADDKWWP
jgi:hypothetical protein